MCGEKEFLHFLIPTCCRRAIKYIIYDILGILRFTCINLIDQAKYPALNLESPLHEQLIWLN